ncbi:exodeoxyribonuclease V subunit gamma [Thioflexithrix psekupsensis]|uniref:RecBCD enzyme subunit RecC n=1 Tax=Thioflexithrix psekupsensis TaxID=1570016 RepID=A0A251X5H2_9GAMM|nr:exodeoxyribonuclease V subunit gamma [Thioflexithrix psekupsensis]OUD12449.1 exodeoxyribonuclease V subunit gamma [Thioflexithrix psekupsensis]
MFHIYHSNRLEQLAEQLSSLIKTPLAHPFLAECIVVQSKGMERWLSMQLAERLGIAANIEFPFPNTIIWRLFRSLFRQLSEFSVFDREVMLWQFMELLPHYFDHPEFAELKNYLHDDPNGVKLFQLSLRIADTFDQYGLYRPDLLFSWENKKQRDGWQSILWNELIHLYQTDDHRAKIWQKFMQADLTPCLTQLPPRISIFGISNLPPVYLETFAYLGQFLEVHLFLFNPCQAHWGYIVSDVEMARLARKQKDNIISPEEQYYEKGNPLLASMGKMARDFFDLIQDYSHQSYDLFIEAEQDSLLHLVQNDILNLQNRPIDQEIGLINPRDQSLQIHICHSPMREVEVLYDQLLNLFEMNSQLLPRDIVIMVPKIEDYAPFIEAVFGVERQGKMQLPFSIADRDLRHESSLVNTFIAILELERGRFPVLEVLNLLEMDAVQRRFALSDDDLILIKHWIQKTAICWGMDAANRAQLKLPALPENTWRAGLERLLLGFALIDQQVLFEDILPFDEIEGQETLILGKLAGFIEQLFTTVNLLSQSHSPIEWANLLLRLLGQFFQPSETQEIEAQHIRKVIQQLATTTQIKGFEFEQPLGIAAIIAYLRNYLNEINQPVHFLTGQITFCTLLPMRSIPFKVVCLLGMNDHSYPRVQRPLSFDLMAQYPKKGDRSLRHNDRYLFLEALLSARNHFYLSYVGHSVQDNSELPPSVLVSELKDYLMAGFKGIHGEKILELIQCHHPLQPFSPHYFMTPPLKTQLFSYSKEYCQASSVLLKKREAIKADFLTQALPYPDSHWTTVDVLDLLRFFKNPTQYLLKERLDINLSYEEQLLEENEPFNLVGLNAYQFTQELIEAALAGEALTPHFNVAKAKGLLPHGVVGKVIYDRIESDIKPFIHQVKTEIIHTRLTPQAIHLTLGAFQLSAYLDHLWNKQQFFYRYADMKGDDVIKLWLYHLLLNSQNKEDSLLPNTSIFLAKDSQILLRPIPSQEACVILQNLLDFYWQGCCELMPFFPKTAWSYAINYYFHTEMDREKSLIEARKTWRNDSYQEYGEFYQSPYYELAFQHDTDQLIGQRFITLTERFFQPFFAHAEISYH